MTRRGDWVQTYTGIQFWPLDPRPEEVCIEDIAHHLSMTCRYGGAVKQYYSVAQHSLLVSEALERRHPGRSVLWQWGLLHDAAEAYLPDVPRPVKPFLSGFSEIEAKVMAAVCERFGLPQDEPPEIKAIDTAIVADEARHLMCKIEARWKQLTEPPLDIIIKPKPSDMAEMAFIKRYRELWGH